MTPEIKKELESTVSLLPDQPPDGTIATCVKRKLLKGDALIYKLEYVMSEPEFVFDRLRSKKIKMVRATCTHCRATGLFDYAKDNRENTYGFRNGDKFEKNGMNTDCPFCGNHEAVIRATSFLEETMLAENWVLTVHAVKGHLCLLEWRVAKYADRDGIVRYQADKNEAIIVIGKTVQRACGWYNYFTALKRTESWEARGQYDERIVGVEKKKIMPFDPQTVYVTDADKSALERLVNDLKDGESIIPGGYLKLWTKHPNVENLVRRGLSGYVNEMISDCMVQNGYYYSIYYSLNLKQTETFVNWKKNKPHEMLGVEKSEIDVVKRIGLYKKPLFVYAKQKGANVPVEKLEKLRDEEAARAYWLIKNDDLPVLRTVNYLLKHGQNVRTLQDYWDLLVHVYGTIPESERFPKKLNEAHDRLIGLKKEKENKALDETIKKRANALRGMQFEADGLTIILPTCSKDFVTEGEKLSHCVARYAERHASGSTTILFVRRTDQPKTPFYTLEYKDGVIVQDHGLKNCSQTPEVLAFEKKWLEHLKRGDKHGKRSAASEEQRTGA